PESILHSLNRPSTHKLLQTTHWRQRRRSRRRQLLSQTHNGFPQPMRKNAPGAPEYVVGTPVAPHFRRAPHLQDRHWHPQPVRIPCSTPLLRVQVGAALEPATKDAHPDFFRRDPSRRPGARAVSAHPPPPRPHPPYH